TDPLTMTTTFRQNSVVFNPNVTADAIDPDNIQPNPLNQDITKFNLTNQIRATNFAKDQDVVGAANLRVPLSQGRQSLSFLKMGIKGRDKQKGRDRNEFTVTPVGATLPLTSFTEADGPPRSYLDGRYDLTPFIDQDLVAKIPDLGPVTVVKN